ncbi:MAG: LysR family transcriptional regulator [Pseudonocardia sp. SCN 72-86]|nr:MAG: LysR family transcriptional regulator [Pseudonocardia sp. SCN 72-86]
MARDLLIRQLEYLVALAREEHFGRAARVCHASQPALSTGIRKLEHDLGVTLVHHGRRFGGFTAEGRRVLGWAHRILAEREGMRIDLDRMRQGLAATLRIGAIPTAIPVTALVTAPFVAQHPLTSVRLEELPSTEIVQRLGDYTLDVGLTYLDGDPPAGTRAVPLYRERYLLLAPEGAVEGGRTEIGWAEAVDRPLCTLTRLMRNRRILEAAVANEGAVLRPRIEADSVAGVFSHVSSAGLSSIVAHTWLRTFGVPAGMSVTPLTVFASPAVGLVTAADDPLSLVASAVLDALDVEALQRALEPPRRAV